MDTLVVNFFGGPGVGKSTIAAQTFSHLKWLGINCEVATEFAKDLVWEERYRTLDDQIYLFGKQYHRIFRLNGQVEVVLTDSPLLFASIYDTSQNPYFRALVFNLFDSFHNLNFLLQREKPYMTAGRLQTEGEAIEKDRQIRNMLRSHHVPLLEILASQGAAVDDIVPEILRKIGKSTLLPQHLVL